MGYFSLYASLITLNLFRGIITIEPSLWWNYDYFLSYAAEMMTNSAIQDVWQTVYFCTIKIPTERINKFSENTRVFYQVLKELQRNFHVIYGYYKNEDSVRQLGCIKGNAFYLK